MQSGAYSAEFGRSGGGVVSFITKSGGQKWHGALYEYFQDGNLNANGWQRNRRNLRRINELSRISGIKATTLSNAMNWWWAC